MGCATHLFDRKKKAVQSVRSPHPRDTANPWGSKKVTKFQKAFGKAMRLMAQPKVATTFPSSVRVESTRCDRDPLAADAVSRPARSAWSAKTRVSSRVWPIYR
jgi:hypothetical protein